ncbi:MAG TPA: sugar phosphate isomerase/epimerase [Bacillota bacterium]|nr:sugar phosphate isomerase/epimerase [Bacillota bacterium]
MSQIALQLYSVREAAESSLLKTIGNVAEMGYEGVQFAGFFNHSAQNVHSKMSECGILSAGAHVPITDFDKNLDDVLRFHDEIENELLICPYLPEEMRQTADDYKRTAERFNQIGKQVKEAGFMFGYHNHQFEFTLFDGKTGFDILFENTDPEWVKMELDSFWASNAGYHPLEIIRTYADRCVSLHIKDMKEDGDTKISTEIGTGSLSFEPLIQAGNENGIDWLVVEQEDFTKDPLVSATENAEALRNIVEGIKG